MTAKEVAREYAESAAWVPVSRVMPPTGEAVEVLYFDGYVMTCRRSGQMFFLAPDFGTYRYVDPMFWRPIEKTDNPAKT